MTYVSMLNMFRAWQKEAKKFNNGKITEDEYNTWRYNYPKVEAERTKERLDSLRAERKLKNDEND